MEQSEIRGRRTRNPGLRGVYHRARIRVTRWLHPGYAASPAQSTRGTHHEATDDTERSQPQSLGRTGAAYLRHHDAGANQGELREGRGATGARAFFSPVEP